ncbi:murein biosynthesis integral membrane protein MurJ [Lipingzhangella sp. LS1_29]|uniref:Murein biosynthesis integral membrane protein MurJ n=1 Tax=Lipingzhangella rawalii TaxID=2055835 RepID=A0ABU2H9E2_9ACTN|nr:murein biosynthesis integral membrane protein MurJ [Lipingzhangella rawalii]MDS1271460.1 murein biosynthesis integral membrane protein MurJ [Lipingzhangella rawalii]
MTGDGGQDDGSAGSSVVRSSMVMAVGTLFSRITGFGRTVVLAAALGTQLLGDAYNTALTIPFIIEQLFLGGLMASVIVPFLVKRRKRDEDGGRATENRLFTAIVLALLVLTTVAILSAELLIRLYSGNFTPAQFDVSVALARFLFAQIFFLGMSGFLSAMLHTRNRFGAPVWAPVLNNLVIMAVGGTFLAVAGPGTTPEEISDAQIALLGIGTASGFAVQALILFLALSAAGFRWRPRLDLRGSGLGEALRTAGWMFVYIISLQIALLITANLANRAGVAAAEGDGVGAGITAYNYAHMLFQLPYAIIAVSIITVLLPQMSDRAADHRWDEVRADFSRGLRMSSVVLVPAGLAMAVFAVHICVLVFARGSTSVADAQNIGYVLVAFALGLVPFSVFQLMLRVFYAMSDTRTPAFLGMLMLGVHAVLGTTAYLLLDPRYVVVGVAAGYMASFLVGLLVGGEVLRRRLGGLDGRRITGTLLRLHVASAPAVAAGLGIAWWLESQFGLTVVTTLGAPVLGCVLGAGLFLLSARLLRIEELGVLYDLARTRLRR